MWPADQNQRRSYHWEAHKCGIVESITVNLSHYSLDVIEFLSELSITVCGLKCFVCLMEGLNKQNNKSFVLWVKRDVTSCLL